MSVDWIEYKGKRILYANYTGGVRGEAADRILLERQMEMIGESPEPVLLLVNLEGAVMSPGNTRFTKEKLAAFGPQVKRSALAGVIGLKSVIVEGIGRTATNLNQQVFSTLDEAMEWLVSETNP